jgi:hypothetical protein
VRTTVNIDDHLLAEAKVVAPRGHRTLGDVIDDALRFMLSERSGPTAEAGRVVLPTDGGTGLQPGVDLEDKESLAELLGDNSPFDVAP